MCFSELTSSSWFERKRRTLAAGPPRSPVGERDLLMEKNWGSRLMSAALRVEGPHSTHELGIVQIFSGCYKHTLVRRNLLLRVQRYAWYAVLWSEYDNVDASSTHALKTDVRGPIISGSWEVSLVIDASRHLLKWTATVGTPCFDVVSVATCGPVIIYSNNCYGLHYLLWIIVSY